MHSLHIVIGFAAVLICASEGHARPSSYVCTVEGVSRSTDEGTLKGILDDPMIGKEFTVDRESGKIIGRYIGSDGYDTQVLDRGSQSQTFKVLVINRLGAVHVRYLEIREFIEGMWKPFLLIDLVLVYSGRCV